MRTQTHTHAVVKLAERQHGVVDHQQLLRIGLSRSAIKRLVAAGWLVPVHRGVYAVGRRRLDATGRRMAAVLAAGSGAVLSHRSAAAHWGIRGTEGPPRIDVTVPRQRRSRPGIRAHRALLPPDEITRFRGIPITTIPRTLLDLAATAQRHDVERVINQAEVLRLGDALPLDALIARYPRRPGSPLVRAILGDGRLDVGVPRNVFEAAFQDFLRAAGLPSAEMNAHIDVGDRLIEVDCVWREHRLVVELDGRAVHATAAAFEADRARDRALVAAGWRVIRITWRHLRGDPRRLAADLRAAL